MSITVRVTYKELPEDIQGPYPIQEDQSTSLLAFEEKCREFVAGQPVSDAKNAQDSRHFWYNRQLQQHIGRTIAHVSNTSLFDVDFCRDLYLVTWPQNNEDDCPIDPELKVSDVLTGLLKKYKVGNACCYELLNGKGEILDQDKTLFELKVWPYTDPTNKKMSHLQIRLRPGLKRQAYFLILACAVAGLALGWTVHHFGKL